MLWVSCADCPYMENDSDAGDDETPISEAERELDATDGRTLDVVSDPEGRTITFIPHDVEDGTKTTAWLTTDADVVVDVTEMQ